MAKQSRHERVIRARLDEMRETLAAVKAECERLHEEKRNHEQTISLLERILDDADSDLDALSREGDED